MRTALTCAAIVVAAAAVAVGVLLRPVPAPSPTRDEPAGATRERPAARSSSS